MLYWKVCRHLHKYLIDTWFCIFIKHYYHCLHESLGSDCLMFSDTVSDDQLIGVSSVGARRRRQEWLAPEILWSEQLPCNTSPATTTSRNTFQIENTKQNYWKQQIYSTRMMLFMKQENCLKATASKTETHALHEEMNAVYW